MTDIPADIGALTLFVEDLPAARAFYQAVFGIPVHYEDDASVVFKFGATLVNLLDVREAPELVTPAPVAGPEARSVPADGQRRGRGCRGRRAAAARRHAAQWSDGPPLGHSDRQLPRPGRPRLGGRELAAPRGDQRRSCSRGLVPQRFKLLGLRAGYLATR